MVKNRLQEFVFSIAMSFLMAYGMETYNKALLSGGMNNSIFIGVLSDVWWITIIVYVVEHFFGGPLARHLALRMFNPEEDKPIFFTLALGAMTVAVMCPTMSLVATLIFKHPGLQLPAIWLQTFVCDFPMAFCYQMFICGPLLRNIFRVYNEWKEKNTNENEVLEG